MIANVYSSNSSQIFCFKNPERNILNGEVRTFRNFHPGFQLGVAGLGFHLCVEKFSIIFSIVNFNGGKSSSTVFQTVSMFTLKYSCTITFRKALTARQSISLN